MWLLKVRHAAIVAGSAFAVVAGGYFLYKQYLKEEEKKKLQKAREKWKSHGGEKVVLHMFPRPNSSLSMSPFVAKLECYLRVANIDYIADFEYPYSPQTGKSPWITLNGEDISDSQVILEKLAKTFNKNIR